LFTRTLRRWLLDRPRPRGWGAHSDPTINELNSSSLERCNQRRAGPPEGPCRRPALV